MSIDAAGTLVLQREQAFRDLLGDGRSDQRWEASGVLARDGRLQVVFDNVRKVAILDEALTILDVATVADGPGEGFEDIARDPGNGHLYLLVEALRHDGQWLARVEEYDEQYRQLGHSWLDVPLPSSNKGMEGLTCIARGATTHLLALCEGNWNESGSRGRVPGGGRVEVFDRAGGGWRHSDVVHLPAGLPFTDFSALAAAGDRLAVASQESSAVWIGRLDRHRWSVSGDGDIYLFPRDSHGAALYCSVEGVSWIDADHLAVVSDRAKPGTQEARCRDKGESVHVFALPPST